MRILFLTENFPPETNAAATRVFERAVYWVEWGHEVTIITCAPNFPEGKLYNGYKNLWYQTEKISGITVVRVKTYISANQGIFRRSLDFFSFLVTGFWAGVFQDKHDVVAATSPQIFAAVAGRAIGVIRKTPFVLELGDMWPISIVAVGLMKKGLILRLLEKLELLLYHHSSYVIALTNAFKKNLVSRGVAESKIHVVRNGVDLNRYSQSPKNKILAKEWEVTDKFVVGYFGTHGMAHGLINVLDVAETLNDQSNILFLFVGAGAERNNLINVARDRGLKNVIFKPAQPKSAMPDIWSICDVALVHLKNSPAFSEVLPSKIFEAMAMGKPVLLVSPKGEASELVKELGFGCWVDASNSKQLAEAVQKLFVDEKLMERLSAASVAAAPKHSRERQAQEVLDVLQMASKVEDGP